MRPSFRNEQKVNTGLVQMYLLQVNGKQSEQHITFKRITGLKDSIIEKILSIFVHSGLNLVCWVLANIA